MVSLVVPLIAPLVAVILTGPPTATLLAKPIDPAALLISAMALFEVDQETWVVRSLFVPSVKVPVAIYCCFRPSAKEIAGGVTAMETSVAVVMTSCVVPVLPPNWASMVIVPATSVVAKPFEPEALLIVALVGSEVPQVT